jgi:hypothetical protein
MLGSSREAAQLAASQEVLSSMRDILYKTFACAQYAYSCMPWKKQLWQRWNKMTFVLFNFFFFFLPNNEIVRSSDYMGLNWRIKIEG